MRVGVFGGLDGYDAIALGGDGKDRGYAVGRDVDALRKGAN